MRENNMETLSPDIGEARAFIELQRQECMAMGGNDSESSDFDSLARELESGKISPAKARERAADIRQSKMEYR